jgi:putative heme-binding domain-containing protein
LESIILPSKSIAEGYALAEFKMKSGDVVIGRIEREEERTVSIRPLAANEEVVVIRKTDIDERNLSQLSNMPSGILDTLDEAQILDLLAYLTSDGNASHSAFHSPSPAALRPQP